MQKIKVLEHSENNVCTARAARRYTMRATVCPPSSDEKAALCSKFDRSIANKQYWSTNNGVDCKVLAWQRPKNEEALTKRYFDVVAIPDNAGAFQKRARDVFLRGIELKYKLDNPNLAFSQLTEEEKFQYYLREYGKEQLLACKKGEVDYNLGGEKVDSDFVIEAIKVVLDFLPLEFISMLHFRLAMIARMASLTSSRRRPATSGRRCRRKRTSNVSRRTAKAAVVS